MGKKGKNGHKMNPVRKYGKMALKLLGIGLGAAVALTPAARAAVRAADAGGDAAHKFEAFGDAVGNEYLGLQADGHWNSGKAAVGVGSVLGGLGIMWLFQQLAKRI